MPTETVSTAERVAPPRRGAFRFWLGTAPNPFPEYTPLDECEHCGAMVLTATLSRHHAWHRRQAHIHI
jgi:hypothetical protein